MSLSFIFNLKKNTIEKYFKKKMLCIVASLCEMSVSLVQHDAVQT